MWFNSAAVLTFLVTLMSVRLWSNGMPVQTTESQQGSETDSTQETGSTEQPAKSTSGYFDNFTEIPESGDHGNSETSTSANASLTKRADSSDLISRLNVNINININLNINIQIDSQKSHKLDINTDQIHVHTRCKGCSNTSDDVSSEAGETSTPADDNFTLHTRDTTENNHENITYKYTVNGSETVFDIVQHIHENNISGILACSGLGVNNVRIMASFVKQDSDKLLEQFCEGRGGEQIVAWAEMKNPGEHFTCKNSTRAIMSNYPDDFVNVSTPCSQIQDWTDPGQIVGCLNSVFEGHLKQYAAVKTIDKYCDEPQPNETVCELDGWNELRNHFLSLYSAQNSVMGIIHDNLVLNLADYEQSYPDTDCNIKCRTMVTLHNVQEQMIQSLHTLDMWCEHTQA